MTYVTLNVNCHYEILNQPPWTIRSKSKHLIVPVYKVTGEYKGVCLDYKQYLLHKLIAQQFKPNPDNKSCIMFKDDDHSNITLSNLIYATRSEVIKAQYKRGNRPTAKTNQQLKDMTTPEGLSKAQTRRWNKLHNKHPYVMVTKTETDSNDFNDFL